MTRIPLRGNLASEFYVMDKRFKNIRIWCWEYRKNKENYPGINITADEKTCEIIIDFLTNLTPLDYVLKRTILLEKLKYEHAQYIVMHQKYNSFKKLVFRYFNRGNNEILIENDKVIIDFSDSFKSELIEAFQDIKSGIGDYSIYPDESNTDMCLSIWPCFGHMKKEINP